MRLPNGYGSVYKLKGNRRRPWVARVTTGWTEEGKQEYYYIGYYRTRADAMDALAEYNKNPIGEARDKTFGEIYEAWSKGKYPKIARSTADGYRAGWLRLKAFEDEPIRSIRKSHIQEIIDGMIKEGLSRSLMEKTKTLAVILFDQAMADEIVQTNPGRLVELPATTKSKKTTFTDLEIAKVDKLAQAGDVWAGTIMVLIYTGMRPAEMLKLTQFNIDTENWTITGGIKTDAGRDRVVPVHTKIRGYIKRWYDNPGSRLIHRDGKPISVDYYRDSIFKPALQRANIDRNLTPYSTRHTFATLLDKAKVQTKHIQELIGHSDYATTANVYTHPEVEELRKAVESI